MSQCSTESAIWIPLKFAVLSITCFWAIDHFFVWSHVVKEQKLNSDLECELTVHREVGNSLLWVRNLRNPKFKNVVTESSTSETEK